MFEDLMLENKHQYGVKIISDEIYIPTYYVCNTIIALSKILDFPRGDKTSRDSSFTGIPGDALS